MLALRIFLSFLAAMSAFVISLLAVWDQSPNTLMNNQTIEAWSSRLFRDLENQAYNGEWTTPPKSLEELSVQYEGYKFRNSWSRMVRDGVLVDGWGRPYIFESDETTFTLITLGRDGLPGGTGFDRDRSVWNFRDSQLDYNTDFVNPPKPTLRQFLFELPTKGMIASCMLSGLITFLAALVIIRPKYLSAHNIPALLINIIGLSLVTVIFALLIMQLHIPSGH